MRKIIKGIVNRTWKPFVERYLRKTRIYTFRNISVTIPPGVFHPGFFFSTHLLISFLEKQELNGKRFLEIGCGSGLVSIFAAKQNAVVTTCDISPLSFGCTKQNAVNNDVKIAVFQSDLFSEIPEQSFDIIAVNPPYYKEDPISIEENAWYCGADMEYFQEFFSQAKKFMLPSSSIYMVLSDECDLDGIQMIADRNKLLSKLALEKRTAWEKGFIFRFYLNE
ncbi:MAG: methyltransferase [Bacteroidia bacterium]